MGFLLLRHGGNSPDTFYRKMTKTLNCHSLLLPLNVKKNFFSEKIFSVFQICYFMIFFFLVGLKMLFWALDGSFQLEDSWSPFLGNVHMNILH